MKNIKISNDISWQHHRSGWAYAVSHLAKYESEKGLIVDGCLDNTFCNIQVGKPKSKLIPYTQEWIGFFHNPIKICPWYEQDYLSPLNIINSETFQKSLPCCKGIFTLSNYTAKLIKQNINKNIIVNNLLHPTENPKQFFSFKKFNKNKKIVQVGTWMRKLSTFFNLKSKGYDKYMLTTNLSLFYLKKEVNYFNIINKINFETVNILRYIDNVTYDNLLSESIVFLDLYDSSANNVIIECIARNTPLIVNRIPSVVEYLGKDYPLYYQDIFEAEDLIHNIYKIKLANEYLKEVLSKSFLSGEFFVDSFFNNTILANV